jgi:cytochrome c biogenesis protein CcmG, thiol:disulfide interchange protein DsbE
VNRWLLVLLLIISLGGAWLWWSRPVLTATATVTDSGPGVGRVAPDFTLPLLAGGNFSLAEQRGKPVVLNFWATWCGPCQRELPAIQRATEYYGDDVVFAGVDQGETAEKVQLYVDKMGLTFAIPMDGDGEVGFQYNVKGLPTTFFIDRDGIIRSIWMGEMNSMTLAENIAKIVP